MPNHGMGSRRRRAHRLFLLRRDGDACQDCGQTFTDEMPPTFEHRVPRSKGGSNARSNLELLCEPCNVARADRPPAAPP